MGVNLSTLPLDSSPEQVQGLQLIQVARYYTTAVLAVAVWDWLVCFYAEYERIWRERWSLIKVLYLITRYVGLIAIAFATAGFTSNISYEQCIKFNRLEPGIPIISTLSGEAILIIRVIALWQKHIVVVIGLCTLFALEGIILVVAATQFIAVPLPPGGTGCFSAGAGKVLPIMYWAFPSLVDAILFALTAYKAYEYWRRSASQSTPLLKVIMRDGTMYFAIVFFINLVNTVFYAGSNIGLQPLNSPMSISISTILCCRLVLNLRAEATTMPQKAVISSNSGRTRDNLPTKSVISHAIRINPNGQTGEVEFDPDDMTYRNDLEQGSPELNSHEMGDRKAFGGGGLGPGGVRVDVEVDQVYEKQDTFDTRHLYHP